MDSTTDTIARPGSDTLPPPGDPVATAPWPGQISQAAPSLPTVVAAIPRPATAPSAFASALTPTPPASTVPTGSGTARRAVSWILLLAAVGGLGYAGVQYGPELIERVGASTGVDEPEAPLVYPSGSTAPARVRSATFTVDEIDAMAGTPTYEATVDFETGVSRVVISRPDTADLEVLTLYDQAVIRRVDDDQWYSLPGGDFPVDLSLGRARWVRTIDELVPAGIRRYTTIEDATESTVGTVAVRRLVISADPAQLLRATTPAPATSGADPALVDGVASPNAPMEVVLAPGIAVAPGVQGIESLAMEVWIDADGLVRKSVMPPELGGETITVTSVSPDAWVPVYPTPEQTRPITAQSLFHLGI